MEINCCRATGFPSDECQLTLSAMCQPGNNKGHARGKHGFFLRFLLICGDRRGAGDNFRQKGNDALRQEAGFGLSFRQRQRRFLLRLRRAGEGRDRLNGGEERSQARGVHRACGRSARECRACPKGV